MQKLFIFVSLIVITTVWYISINKVHTNHSFYHWKQSYSNTENTEPKYIKVMDISYESKSKIHLSKFNVKPQNTIVPVIYIDNPVFKHENAKTFAKKLFSLLEKQAKNTFDYNEVQIDCDWSDSTKEAYFLFLKTFKKLSQKQLSSTIRLHQIKYHQRTGVPPVDKGVLMYYNMANFKDMETKNYILDLGLAKQYHYNFDSYPLPLDLALPLYAQATIMRFESVIGIMEGVRKKELTTHFKALENNYYEVTKTHYFKKRLLYEGDILRVDEVNISDLKQAVENLKEVMKQPEEIIFYRWGNRKSYNKEKLKELSNW